MLHNYNIMSMGLTHLCQGVTEGGQRLGIRLISSQSCAAAF